MSAHFVSIEAIELRVPLSRRLRIGPMEIAHRDYVLVRIRDSDGHEGSAYGLTRNAPVAQMVAQAIAPRWLGQPLETYPELYRGTARANVCLGTNGVFWRALSVTDCAAHDLLARRAGLSLANYLGGAPRAVPAMLIGGYPSDDATEPVLQREIEHLAERRPAGIKIASCGNLEKDSRRLRVCRDALRDGTPLMVDCGWSAPPSATAIAQARRWEELNIGWIEDPYGFDDFEETAALAQGLPFPVAVGDEQSGERHFNHLMDLGSVGIVRLDATVCGGITAFLRIARQAATRGRPIACHIFPELHVHLAAVASNTQWVEEIPDDSGIDARHLFCRTQPVWRDGAIVPASGPGIGYVWDEAALRAYSTCVIERRM